MNSAFRRGDELELRLSHVLETADDADFGEYKHLAATLGSEREAAIAWQFARIAKGLSKPDLDALLILPAR